MTEKKGRRAKAPAVNLTPEQEEVISEWLKQNPWLWDRNVSFQSLHFILHPISPDWVQKFDTYFAKLLLCNLGNKYYHQSCEIYTVILQD